MPKGFDTYSLNYLPEEEALDFLIEMSANLSSTCSAMARLEKKTVPSFGHTKDKLLKDIRAKFAALVLFMHRYDPGMFDKETLQKEICDFAVSYILSQMTDQIEKDAPGNPIMTPSFLSLLKAHLLQEADKIMKDAEAPLDKGMFDNTFNSSAEPIDEDALIDIMRSLNDLIPKKKPDQDKPE